MTSLAIFGAGRIGGGVAEISSALGIVDEIILYDVNEALLTAQKFDLLHAGHDILITTDPDRIKTADIVVFTAGIARNPSIKTRAHLLEVNIPVAKACAATLTGFKGILITVTNPTDVLNYYLWKLTGLPKTHIIGFGGQLDSQRYSCELKSRKIIHDTAIVMGEHGEHQVPLFTNLNISYDDRNDILNNLRGASMIIIKGKGATEYAPVWHVTMLIQAILKDQRKLLQCSCIMTGEYGISGCSLGIPAIIGRNGIIEKQIPELDDWERNEFLNAASFVTDLCRSL